MSGTIPLYVGTLFNCTLFGVLLVQICIYFLAAFPHDRRRDKRWCGPSLQSKSFRQLATSKTRAGIRTRMGDPSELNKVGMVWFNVPLLGSIVAAVGQTFFAYRIYIIGKSWYLPAFSHLYVKCLSTRAPLSSIISSLAGSMWCWYLDWCDHRRAGHILQPPIQLLQSTCCVAYPDRRERYRYRCRDVLLSAQSTRAGLLARHGKHALARVMKVTTITGLVCAVLALADLTIFAVFPQASFHLGLCMGLSKVYSNSILVILNSRARISLRRDEAPSEVSGLNFRLTGLKTGGGADTGFETRQSTDM
ncbi:unnamed protein product [Mycena citricolor]|uniref:DUF6534 domain-containing protein n=1 Tax=Mycena citricolor TaxID=2018698 RepID=A0AAD2Q5W5_9AGAR|nr:unnamed protein product [Mycena citricolor]